MHTKARRFLSCCFIKKSFVKDKRQKIDRGEFVMNNMYFKKTIVWLVCLVYSFLLAGAETTKKLSAEQVDYIIKKYECIKFGKPHLFYPAKNPKRLLIVFAGAGAKGQYNLFSWYWRDDENWADVAYLFLRDDDVCWYIGNNEQDFIPDYSNLIRHYINTCKLDNSNVYTIGSSMGGMVQFFMLQFLALELQ